MRNDFIGVILLLVGSVVFVGCWWGVWDLLNAVRYWTPPEFYAGFRFNSPFFLLHVTGENWSVAFDTMSWLGIVACIVVGVGGYLVGVSKK